VPGLKVIARTSAFAFKGKLQDVRVVAAGLGVGTVLEGSVRRAGTRVRVTVQLVLASDGTQLWSQRFDREMAGIFEMQDEISSAIAGTLKLKLTAAAERRTPSIPAYEAYLKYRVHQWQFTPDAAERSRECLEQALALDSGFALPYVGLADYHLARATVGATRAFEAMPRARELAQRARARSGSAGSARDARHRRRPLRLRLGRAGTALRARAGARRRRRPRAAAARALRSRGSRPGGRRASGASQGDR
jgi:hypothetical protein